MSLSTTAVFSQEKGVTTKLINKGPILTQTIARSALAEFAFRPDSHDVAVRSFKIRLGTESTLQIEGYKLTGQAIAILRKLPKKSKVILFDIIRDGISNEEAAIQFILED